MKANNFTSAFGVLVIILIAASCSSSKSSSKKYPYPGSPYPQQPAPGEKAPTDKGPIEKSSSPSTTGLPPGQAKKIYGEKSAKVFAPGQRKKLGNKYYPLVIVRTPDIIIVKHTDGRYYYKNADNYIYWKGNDDRFYLDEQYIDEVEYDKGEWNDWKTKGKSGETKIPPGQQKKENNENHPGEGNQKKKSKKD
jgi:hypothetical protein